MSIIQTLKQRSTFELIIGVISLLVGGFLIWYSSYFIYSYHFTKAFWFSMIPMTELVSIFMIVFLLIASSLLLTEKNNLFCTFYKFTGIVILLFFIFNVSGISLIYITLNFEWYNFIYPILPIISGIFLFLFFNQKRYKSEKKYWLESNIALLFLAVTLYAVLYLGFVNWKYF